MLAGMHQYIGGERRAGSTGESFDVLDPSTDEVRRVGDPRRARTTSTPPSPRRGPPTPSGRGPRPVERSAVLTRAAALLDERAEELAQLESRQAGKPIRLAREFDVPGTVDNTAFFGAAARRLDGMATGEYSGDHTSSIRREPIGVVGSIAPWNYPLQMAAWKVLPAIAAGNTIVLKPAEITPLTALPFAEAFTEAGAPPGVVNVVTGTGPVAGEHLVGHPDVAMTSFTGSTVVGRRVMATAAATGKRVHLELGGKAPFVVFDDADLEAAVHGAVAANLINAGQDCTAATRAIVHRSVYDAFVGGVADLYRDVRMGPTADPETDLGPLSSRAHLAKVAGMVDRARAYAKVVCGGAPPTGDLARGCYYEPTVVTDVAARLRDLARRGLRAGARRRPVRRRRRGHPARQRHRVRARRLAPGPATPTAPAGPPARSRPAACGSTTTSRSSARCRTAGTSPPASARTCPRTPSTSTRTSSTSCTTSPARRASRGTARSSRCGAEVSRSAPAGPVASPLTYREGMSDLLPGDPLRTAVDVAHRAVDAVRGLIGGSEHPPLPTVEHVDVARYAGCWYELARLPVRSQPDESVGIAEYGLRDNGTVSVHLVIRHGSEPERTVDGSAQPAEGAELSHARLRVRLGGVVRLAPTPVEGNYWVLRLADDYSTALVGTPDRSALWLLARHREAWGTPTVQAYLAWAQQHGFDLAPLLVADWTTRTTRPYRATAHPPKGPR